MNHNAAYAAVCLAAAAFLALIGSGSAEQRPARVLTLLPYSNQSPIVRTVEYTLRKRFAEAPGRKIELFTDYLDFIRFPEAEFQARTAQYLVDKYAIAHPDVILAFGYFPVQFSLRYRDKFAPGASLIIVADMYSRDDILKIDNATGVQIQEDLAKVLALARRLQPTAKKVTVVSGGSERDQVWSAKARQQLAPYDDHYDIEYLDGLPHIALLQKVGQLPSNSIVLLTTLFADGAGRSFTASADAAEDIAKASSAPVYGLYESFIGRGVVGAYAINFESWGDVAADLALQVLSRIREKRPLPEPIIHSAGAYQVDARQLDRWNFSESALPPSTTLRFVPFSLWREYRYTVLLVVIALIGQSLLIAGLIYEHRRRHTAEVANRRRIAEIAVLNRRAAIGEMSASIAHEIKQPLAAIVTNSDVCRRWLGKDVPNVGEARVALMRIVEDVYRANKVVDSIRGMFRKESPSTDLLDVNGVIRDVLGLLRIELNEHDVIVRTGLQDDVPLIAGNRIQLQQVVLNLVRNAIEAMDSGNSMPRILKIGSAATEPDEVIVTIEDSGPGVDPKIDGRLFEPFATTKGTGMGMGLSICRSIVEAHNGRITVTSAHPNGAVFEITLPIARNA